jgi:hypothetical protein
MKRILLIVLIFTTTLTFAQEKITNQSIIELVELGFDGDLIITKIQNSNCDFDTSISELKKLKKSNVPKAVIKLMMGSSKKKSEGFNPTEPESIEIFTATLPTKEYVEIGMVSVLRIISKLFPLNRPTKKVMAEMKKKASAIGGNAIINYRESGEANMTGTIIRYK